MQTNFFLLEKQIKMDNKLQKTNFIQQIQQRMNQAD